MRKSLVCLLVAVGVAAIAAGPGAAADSRIEVSVITDRLNVSNVVPTWGAQIPKIAYDGEWYYAVSVDSDDDAKYPWRGLVFKSRDAQNWTVAVEMRDPDSTYVCTTCGSTRPSEGPIYQPPALLFDNQRRLHLQAGCWNGDECYPGVPSAPGNHTAIYTLRLVFSDRLPDGSIDFTRFADHSLREGTVGGPPISRYYQGLSLDPTGRYVYAAFAGYGPGESASNPADSVGPAWFSVFDTQTGEDVFTSKIGIPPNAQEAPPCGRAWIYFRVRPGLQPGEVFLSFEQVILCESFVNSAPLDAAWLWRSTDGGRTFPERVKTAEVPYADGYTSWVDSSDSTVDAGGIVHAISYKRSNGLATMLYQEGMHGTPVDIGTLDNHSQIVVAPDRERFVFSNQDFPLGYTVAPSEAGLVVARSPDGVAWSREFLPIPGYKATFWPNMLGPLNGSAPLPHRANERVYGMLLAAQKPGESRYSTLLFVRYSTRIPAPDLRVAAISASDREPREGQPVMLTATIENAGDAPAPASTTQFTLDGTTVLGSVATPAIPAGGTARVTVAWDTRGVHGEHVVAVAADSLDAVHEPREDNNTASLAVRVRGKDVFDGFGSFE